MLEEKVLGTIKKYNMLSFNDRVLIGVSGGADSVSLLKILLSLQKRYSLSIYIAHLNHMLRGKESDEDANFVENLAQELNIPYQIQSLDLVNIARKRRLTFEEASREYRYRFYSKTAQKFKANKIALGHNADDQVETILMRFLRGSGLEGLLGIPPVRDKIIRPLIECTREEVEKYCQKHKLKFRVDSSNQNVKYFRNKIRLKLLPLLSNEYNKNLKDVILHLQIIIDEVSSILERETKLLFEDVLLSRNQKEIIINLKKMNLLPLAFQRKIIRKSIEIVKGNLYSIDFNHSEKILRLTEHQSGEKEVYLPDNLRIKKSYDQLIIYKKEVSKNLPNKISASWEYNLSIPGHTKLTTLGIMVNTEILDYKSVEASLQFQKKKSNSEFVELIDYHKIKCPLKLRNRRIGDKFYPLKMTGRKRVKEFFIDNKVSKSHRDLIPILVDNENNIVWIVGMRLDDRVKVTSASKKILYIKVKTNRKLPYFSNKVQNFRRNIFTKGEEHAK